MIKVSNTKTMAVLLDALNIRRYEWKPTDDGIEINLNSQQLLYAINGSSEAVQHIYGKTPEWSELCNHYVKGMTV